MKDFGGIGNLMQQAQKFQQQMKEAQELLAKKTVEASSGGGMIQVTANGKQQIVSIRIDPEIFKMNDPQMLQDLLVAGVNEALKSAQELAAQEMKGKMAENLGPLGSLLNMFS